MGAEAAVGRDEVRLRGSPLTPLDEPLRRLPVQAIAGEAQERRPRVLGVSLTLGHDPPVDSGLVQPAAVAGS